MGWSALPIVNEVGILPSWQPRAIVLSQCSAEPVFSVAVLFGPEEMARKPLPPGGGAVSPRRALLACSLRRGLDPLPFAGVVTGAEATRSDVLPDVPTVDEFVPGYEASAWCGIGAPRGTSAEIINKLNSAINGCLADPTLKARLAEVGAIPFLSSPTDFGHFIAAETEKWAKVINSAGMKQE